MDLNQIRELLKIVAESEVAEVEVKQDSLTIIVRKAQAPVVIQSPPAWPAPFPMMPAPYGPAGYPMMPAQAPAPVAAAPTAAPQAPQAPVAEKPAPAANEHIIRSPIVGTFYRASAPDSPPLVQIGDTIKPGDVLCVIEAMKLMNEIESEVSGTIKQILVSNAEPVEYDQPLFVVELA